MMAVLWCVLGLAALLLGAELLIRAGTTLAALMRIPPIIIGLTVVSVGTSLPELAVGIDAALIGSGGLAVGNIAGTNAFNLLFILGMSALLAPLAIEQRTLRIDLPAMVVSAFAFLVMAWDGRLTRLEGLLLLAGAAAYTALVIGSARSGSPAAVAQMIAEFDVGPVRGRRRRATRSTLLLLLSIAVIIVGADRLVQGAVDLARALGVSEAFIGLTVVAIGTSAPELVTTVVSTLRRQRDIAIGNLLGSSTYNILVILGATVAVAPEDVEFGRNLVDIDIPVVVLVTLLCVPVFATRRSVSRLEGGLFVAAYLAYLSYLIVDRT